MPANEVRAYLEALPMTAPLRASALQAVLAGGDDEAIFSRLDALPIDAPVKDQLWKYAHGDYAKPSFELYKSPSQEAAELGTTTDYNRPDNSLLGMPPESLVIPGIGIGRAMMGGLSTGAKAAAGAKAAYDQAAPAVKYELAKQGLESVGVPSAVAIPLAIAVSGYRRGRAPVKAKVETAASPASPPASRPVAPAPEVAPSAPVTARPSTPGSSLSPQRIQNELGIQARRQKVTLTESQYQAATELVTQGRTPTEAVAEMAKAKVATPVPAATTPAPAPAAPTSKVKAPRRAKLTADEADEYLRLTGKGLSHEQAVEALMQQRKLAAKLGTPTPEAVRRRVEQRNKTGRWPTDE